MLILNSAFTLLILGLERQRLLFKTNTISALLPHTSEASDCGSLQVTPGDNVWPQHGTQQACDKHLSNE